MSDNANTTIIVPINVEALRISPYDTTRDNLKGAEFDFSEMSQSLPNIALGSDVTQSLLNTSKSNIYTNKAGIRLHWALPKALVRGTISTDNPTQADFPTLPNRWLITAFYYDNKKTVSSQKQWIIKSDVISDSATPQAICIPHSSSMPTPEVPLSLIKGADITCYEPKQYLGSYTDINDWTETSETFPLKATSFYGPTFTAYYQHCAGSFGFYDDLSDFTSQDSIDITASYQVIGWHSDNSDDIITTLNKKFTSYNQSGDKNFYTFLKNELGWELASPTPSSTTLDTSIYNGMILNISYKNSNKYLQDGATNGASSLKKIIASVSIGNNPSEAVSALLCKDDSSIQTDIDNIQEGKLVTKDFPKLVGGDGIEYFFNAFQQDFLRRLGTGNATNRIEKIESFLHKNRFSTQKGGHLWSIIKRSNQKTTSKNTNSQLPLEVAQFLYNLNQLQEQYDSNIRLLETKQQELHIAWGNNASKINNSSPPSLDSSLVNLLWDYLELEAKTGAIQITPSNSTLTFKPTVTLHNTTLEGVIYQGIIKTIHSSSFDIAQIKSIGLADMYVLLNIQIPATVNHISKLLANVSNEPSNILGELKQSIYVIENILTLLNAKNSSTKQSLFDTLLANLSSNLDAIQSKSPFTNLQNIVSEGVGEIKNVLSKDPESKEYDIQDLLSPYISGNMSYYDLQMAVIWCQQPIYNYQMTKSADFSELEFSKAINVLLTQTTSDINNIKSKIIDIQNGNDKITDLLTSLSTLKKNIHTKSNTLNTKAPIQELIKQLNQQQADCNTISENMLNITETLLATLPTGQQVVLKTAILNAMTEAMEQDMTLQMKSAPAFTLPNEPVIAITGLDEETEYLQKVNRNGDAKYLPCRQTGNLIQTSFDSQKAIDFSLPDLPNKTIINSLLKEGSLLAPENYSEPTDQTSLFQTLNTLNDDQQYKTLPSTYDIEGNIVLSPIDSSTPILPYYIGLNVANNNLGNRFLPLLLSWEVIFQPADVSSSSIINDYEFQDGLCSDLTPSRALYTKGADTSITFKGQVPMGDTANFQLKQQLIKYFKAKWNIDITSDINLSDAAQQELYDFYNYLSSQTILAQSLSGFNAYLLERLQSYQFLLNINHSFSTENASKHFVKFAKLMSQFENTWNASNPFWKSYLPTTGTTTGTTSLLRAGTLQVSKLEIIDVFGQFLTIIGTNGGTSPDKVLAAQSMQLASSKDKDIQGFGSEIYLSPKLAYPARLNFLWESATGLGDSSPFKEYNPHPAYSPVCGWIMHNHLDNTLFTYDVNGDALGYFAETSDGTHWRNVPSNNTDKTLKTAVSEANSTFKNFLIDFVDNLKNSEIAEGFFETISSINQYMIGTATQESPALSILKGHPLVVTQANINVEAYGNLPLSVSSDVNNNIIEKMDIPMILGNDQFLYDGLVGYFINGDFTTFYATQSTTSSKTITIDGSKTITIKAASSKDISSAYQSSMKQYALDVIAYEANMATYIAEVAAHVNPEPLGAAPIAPSGVTLTLLMDPRVPVHLTSGLFPQQTLEIPKHEYEKAMNNLKIYFSVYPILLGSHTETNGDTSINYRFPLPKEPGFDWSWEQSLSGEKPLLPSQLNDKASLSVFPLEIQDGWLKMSPENEQ